MNFEAKLLARSAWIIGGLLALVVANVLLYVFGVANLDRMARSLKVRCQENAKKLAETEAQAEGLRSNVARISAGRSLMDTMATETFKTRPERLVTVQDELARLMREAGLAADRLGYAYEILPERAAEGKWKRRYLKTTLQVGVNGSYPQVKSFIRALQDSPQFFVVENLSVTTTGQGNVVLHANLIISTYFIATETDRAGK